MKTEQRNNKPTPPPSYVYAEYAVAHTEHQKAKTKRVCERTFISSVRPRCQEIRVNPGSHIKLLTNLRVLLVKSSPRHYFNKELFHASRPYLSVFMFLFCVTITRIILSLHTTDV